MGISIVTLKSIKRLIKESTKLGFPPVFVRTKGLQVRDSRGRPYLTPKMSLDTMFTILNDVITKEKIRLNPPYQDNWDKLREFFSNDKKK